MCPRYDEHRQALPQFIYSIVTARLLPPARHRRDDL